MKSQTIKADDARAQLEPMKTTAIAESYYHKLVDMYRKDRGKACGKVRVQYTTEYDYSLFRDLMKQAKRSRVKSFHIASIDSVDDDVIRFSFSIDLNKKNKNEIDINDQTGIFKLNFSDGTFMYFAKWVTGDGKSRMVDSIFATEDSVWVKLIQLINKEAKKRKKPPVGQVYKNEKGIYMPRKKLKETPVVHESVKFVKEDIDMFFGNLDLFTRWGMPGTRKVMLVGPPGTGKSSLTIRIANQYMKEKNVTFFTDIGSLATHLSLCAKYNVSTICVLEDAESSLQRPESNLLNFLDGIDQPVNPKGAYIIMTTNYPQKIERRILQRPGRVDQIFAFGNLKGEYVMKCAEIYLKDYFFGKNKIVEGTKKEIEDTLRDMFDADGKGITGTRIKQFSEDIVKYAVSKKKKTVTLQEVREVFTQTTELLKTVYEMAQEQGLLEGESVGFDWDSSSPKPVQFDEDDLA